MPMPTSGVGRAIIVLEDLTYFYPGSDTPALENVNLRVCEGEFVVVAGPSGGGKSTLCRVLNGLIPHFYGGRLRGRALVDGIDVSTAPVRELSKRVGMVFQNPVNQIVNVTVEEEIAFGLENMMYPPEVIGERMEWALKVLGIEHLRKRPTYALSGGELQKVALASVLALRPKILALDEVTANMDPYSTRELLRLLRKLKAETGTTIVLVEHRLSEAMQYADRLVLLNRTVVAEGRPRDLLREGVAELLGIEEPPVARLFRRLGINSLPLSVEEAAGVLRECIGAMR